MAAIKKLGVIGHPISHSKSPIIHNYWIKRYGLKAQYEALDVAPEYLEDGLRYRIKNGYVGFNLTVPHKETVLALCDDVDDIARSIGAVNSIRIVNERMIGTNTDAFGFVENIRQNAPHYDFTKGPAVIFGAGGAARAILHALLKENVPEITIINRTREKAEILQKVNPKIICVEDWDNRAQALDRARLVVNATTLGMTGQPDLFIDMFILSQAAIVTDIVYTPLHTDFLKRANARGNTIITGIGMLIHQARPSFQSWFGTLPDVDETLINKVLRS